MTEEAIMKAVDLLRAEYKRVLAKLYADGGEFNPKEHVRLNALYHALDAYREIARTYYPGLEVEWKRGE